jgi:hypothetical protein
MAAKKPATPVDAGLQEIGDWHAWFLGAHRQRLADLKLAPDEYARELAAVTMFAAAVADQLRVEYQIRGRT